MASYIFNACCRLKRWSSRQWPLNCSAISASLLRQRGSRNAANRCGSRSPRDDRPHDGHAGRAVEVRHRPMHAHVHLVQALLHAAQPIAPFGDQRRFCRAPASAAGRPARVGRNAPRSRPQLCSRWIHSQSRRSDFGRPGTRAQLARIDEQHVEARLVRAFRAGRSGTRPCSRAPPSRDAAVLQPARPSCSSPASSRETRATSRPSPVRDRRADPMLSLPTSIPATSRRSTGNLPSPRRLLAMSDLLTRCANTTARVGSASILV